MVKFSKGDWVVRVKMTLNTADCAEVGDIRQIDEDNAFYPYVTYRDEGGYRDCIGEDDYRLATPEEIEKMTSNSAEEPKTDPVNHPSHYTAHPSGIECIQVTEHMGFCIGNAVKYLWRADLKDNAIEDLQKAAWYIKREIDKRKGDV